MLEARQLPDRMLLGGTPVQDEGIDPAELLEAIGGGQLAMHLQPIYDVRQRKVVGAEALARWHHPSKGEISPGVFVRVAETSGMISQLTRWSANACLQVVAEAREAGLSLPVSMNLSATAFAERGLVEQLLGGLKLWNVEPRELVLEVTETAIVSDIQRGAVQLRQLNAAGIRVSIDDFGVGNASVAYLKEFPATEMKIDQSFVTGMLGDLRSLQMVKAMIAFAKQMGMRVVAEGVEDEDTMQALGDLGCNLVQGWAVGKPRPAAELIRDIARGGR
jgi:EAL domain-containing protein (putative c-di-GMP-specific phosphodiesterase class I)